MSSEQEALEAARNLLARSRGITLASATAILKRNPEVLKQVQKEIEDGLAAKKELPLKLTIEGEGAFDKAPPESKPVAGTEVKSEIS